MAPGRGRSLLVPKLFDSKRPRLRPANRLAPSRSGASLERTSVSANLKAMTEKNLTRFAIIYSDFNRSGGTVMALKLGLMAGYWGAQPPDDLIGLAKRAEALG